MAKQGYMALAVALVIGALAYAFWDEGGEPPWDPRGVHSARVRPTWTLDLETGGQGTAGADLPWGMKARDDPFLAASGGALIARTDASWDSLDARSLPGLAYTTDRFSERAPGTPLRKGAVFGVRTRGGSFAKVRVK